VLLLLLWLLLPAVLLQPHAAARGKFDMAFYADSLQVTNKQTSALIPYSSIQHVLVSSSMREVLWRQQQRRR
jgi:hypothetical protein